MTALDPTLVRNHLQFFFSDGNVVFFAGTCPAIAFCLHRCIVNRWSPKFHDMLEALEAAADPLRFHGRSVIELNDAVEDFEQLVRVMYNGTSASLPSECTLETFPHIASILLLSHKYAITHLFDYARVILHATYPFTLSAWDVREVYEFIQTKHHNRLESVRRHPPPLAVVSLALQLDAPHLLVPAFLDLVRLPVSEIIRGYTVKTSIATHAPAVTFHLQPKQVTAVLRGKETLQRFIADFIKSNIESRPPAPQCPYLNIGANVGPSPCMLGFARLAHDMLVLTADISCGVDSDPLFVLRYALGSLEEEKDGSCGVCGACTDWFRQSVHAARQHVWASLDKWFDMRKILESGFSDSAKE